MAVSNKRWLSNWALALLVVGGLAAALWPRLEMLLAPPAAAMEHGMPQQWNPQAKPPPIDAAQPGQYKTATFAVG